MTDTIPTWQSVKEPTPHRLIISEERLYLRMEWRQENCPWLFRGFPTLRAGESECSPKRQFARGCGFIHASSLESFVQLLADQLVKAEGERNLLKGHCERGSLKLVERLRLMTEGEIIAWVADNLNLTVRRQIRRVEQIIEVLPDEIDGE